MLNLFNVYYIKYLDTIYKKKININLIKIFVFNFEIQINLFKCMEIGILFNNIYIL